MAQEFCIVCGAPPPVYAGRLCESCLRDRTHLSKIPERLQQARCSKCRLHNVGKSWSDNDHLSIADIRVQDHLEILSEAEDVDVGLTVEIIDDRTSRISIDVSATVHGLPFDDQHTVLLQTSDTICQTCSRKDGAYFEAEFQIRSAGRRLSKDEIGVIRNTLNEMLGEGTNDPLFFITKEGPVQGGWDLQLGSKSMARMWARRLASRFGGTVKETSTVIGVKDGAEVTRLTVSYRKPAFSIGDVLRLKDKLWIVTSWQKDGPILGSFSSNQRSGKTWRDMEKSSVVCSTSDQIPVQILDRDGSAAEVLIPGDWKMATVALPFDYDGEESIRIGLIDHQWLAIPYAAGGGLGDD